eukprot:s2135_g20.t1
MLAEMLESGAGENDGSYKVVLAALDIKDACLQVPQDKVVMVSLYDQQYIIRRNLPGQRLGAKAWYWHFREYVSKVLNCSWCLEQPCLAKCVHEGVNNCFMIHVDDLLFTGNAEFWHGKFLPAMKAQFNISCSELKEDGSSISFLKRQLVKLSDGLMIVPGTKVSKVISCFEKFFGPARAQKLPCDSSIQNEDKSQMLNNVDSKAYRSVIGLLLYLARDRVDIMFATKELSACVASPTLLALQRLRKLVGYLKATGDMSMKLGFPEFGMGKWKKGGEKQWLLETFTDADWSANRQHRKSTSCGLHFVNNNFAYGSSRTQRVVSLSSAESELHSVVSGCSDAVFIKRCLEFLTDDVVEHWQRTDNSAARQLVARQGVGRIRHLSGKILWIQALVLGKELLVGQIPTDWNYSDIGTKPLTKSRLFALLYQVGALDALTSQPVGEEEFHVMNEKVLGKQAIRRLAKAMFKMAAVWGLEPMIQVGAEATSTDGVCLENSASDTGFTWLWLAVLVIFLCLVAFTAVAFFAWKQLSSDLMHCWNQVGDEDAYIHQEARINSLLERIIQLENRVEQNFAELGDSVQTVSNEVSMTHDYASVSLSAFSDSPSMFPASVLSTGP